MGTASLPGHVYVPALGSGPTSVRRMIAVSVSSYTGVSTVPVTPFAHESRSTRIAMLVDDDVTMPGSASAQVPMAPPTVTGTALTV